MNRAIFDALPDEVREVFLTIVELGQGREVLVERLAEHLERELARISAAVDLLRELGLVVWRMEVVHHRLVNRGVMPTSRATELVAMEDTIVQERPRFSARDTTDPGTGSGRRS